MIAELLRDGVSFGHAVTAQLPTLFRIKTNMAAASVTAPATMDHEVTQVLDG